MTITHTIYITDYENRLASRTRVQDTLKSLFQRVIADLRARRTEKILARLDRATLEDIGVPHEGVALSAGHLDRYKQIIKLEEHRI